MLRNLAARNKETLGIADDIGTKEFEDTLIEK